MQALHLIAISVQQTRYAAGHGIQMAVPSSAHAVMRSPACSATDILWNSRRRQEQTVQTSS